MKPNLLKPIVAALSVALSSAAFATPNTYHFRQHVPGFFAPAPALAPAPACELPWGGSLPPQQTQAGYTNSIVPYGESCDAVQVTVSCDSAGALTTNGATTGSCSVAPSVVGDGVSKAGACASGGASGCATWSTVDKGPNILLTNGDLSANSATSMWNAVRATKAKSAGKWYWELTYGANGGNIYTGLATAAVNLNGANLGYQNSSYGFNPGNTVGLSWPGASALSLNVGTHATGTVLGFALDLDAKVLHVAVNGTWKVDPNMGVVASGLAGIVHPAVMVQQNNTVVANFGQTNFQYPVPAGYNAGLW